MALPTAVLQAATTITAAETLIGSAIAVSSENTLGIYLDYVKNDETNVALIIKYQRISGGTKYPVGTWSAAAGAKTFTADTYVMSVTGNYYLLLNVEGVAFVELYMDATGGTPTGTLAVAYAVDQLEQR